MKIDLATFLVAVYTIVDDVYRAQFAPHKPRRRGHRPELSDSEVLTLMVLAQWQPSRSERAFLRYVAAHWGEYFPRLLSPSAFNRRARDLCGVLCQLGPAVARQLVPALLAADYELLDGVAVPLMSRCRGARHRLFGVEAGIGRGGSDRDWYYGVQLLAVVNPAGLLTGFVLAPAPTEERWAADALLRWRNDPAAPMPTPAELAPALGPSHRRGGVRVGPTGPLGGRLAAGAPGPGLYLADAGFQGAAWARHWVEDYGAAVLTRVGLARALPPTQRRPAVRWLARGRQVIETINGLLTAVFGLRYPRARSRWGLLTRVAAKVAALDLAICINHLFHRPTFAIFNPLG